jgi:hypothetical protein
MYDNNLTGYEISDEGWRRYRGAGPRPAGTAAALRALSAYFKRVPNYDQHQPGTMAYDQGISYARFYACRTAYLADQIDAPRLAQEQAARDAAARAERDRAAREQAARDAALRQEQLQRNRELRALQEAERLRLQQEAEAERAREAAARLELESAKRLAEEEAHQREVKADNDRRRREREEQQRREEAEKPFEARNVSECVTLLPEIDSMYGGFRNSCNFDVYVAFCAMGPADRSWASAFDCDRSKGGLDRIAANGTQAAHTKNVRRMIWFACNAPSTPNVEYRTGSGFWGSCR